MRKFCNGKFYRSTISLGARKSVSLTISTAYNDDPSFRYTNSREGAHQFRFASSLGFNEDRVVLAPKSSNVVNLENGTVFNGSSDKSVLHVIW